MANTKELKIKIDVEGNKEVEKLKESLEKLEIQSVKTFSSQELMQALTPDISEVTKNLNTIIPTISRLVPILDEIDKMNQSILSSASNLATSRMKQIDTEIKSLKKYRIIYWI
ncbi:MAG: hypothetical protein LBN74_00675 [Prevotella sp.]|jgi:tRNA(Ser,Leu) C12 N-acetylase TAN1|nr:hypothetical protein [Prevotella sp.]